MIDWCVIPAGPFRMGRDAADAFPSDEDERPRRVVTLDGFRISRLPVTNRRYHGVGDERPVTYVTRAEAEAFCLGLYHGVAENLADIDARLAAASENWKLHRMAACDRNVLRLGAYEIVHAPEPTPGPVALDEAIELARRYGSEDSPAFVNGVLDKVFRVHTDQKKAPAPEAASAPAE